MINIKNLKILLTEYKMHISSSGDISHMTRIPFIK